jgi:Arc/MetJ-type ribon-helix-helix transcriptional regulator
MKKINLPKSVCSDLENLASEKKIYLEGNILKVIESSEYEDFSEYIKKATENDSEKRNKRLEVTRTVQDQNKELTASKEKNDALMEELKLALKAAEEAKVAAESDLDIMQKKTQFELIGNIVNYALYVIVGTGIVTTGLYLMAMMTNSSETTLIGNTWSNLFGILLTNSFSIIGTIMGVKYASEGKDKES